MTVFARGKVILLGEHSVVHGRPGLAAALGIGVSASAAPAEADVLAIAPWDVVVRPEASSDEALARAFAAVLETYPDPRPRLALRAEVGLPPGAGLGCSAALGVAVVGALDAALGVTRTDAERGEAALVWERVFHGNPSGLDNAMAASGGVARFVRGAPLRPVRVGRPLPLVVCHSGEPSLTRDTVASVGRQLEREPARMNQVFDAIADLVDAGCAAIERGDLPTFGKLMDANQMLLASMLVSTERLEQLCRTAKEAGALGAKLTGGGGGGCMYALAGDLAAASHIADALRALGTEPFVVEAGA